jgi:hypothetical protein
MSRYVILTEDENLEVFAGFDEGFEKFFLTIADARTCTGESGSYLFHNLDHHPGLGMTLTDVATTLKRFGITLPADLETQLHEDAVRNGAGELVRAGYARTSAAARQDDDIGQGPGYFDGTGSAHILGWQAV